MANIFLGLAAAMVAWGAFLTVSCAFSRTLPERIKVGRFLRGVITETCGFLLFLGAWGFGVKPPLAIPVLIVSLGVPSMIGIVHTLLQNRIKLGNDAPQDSGASTPS